jgi:hypothetical protein
MSSLPLHAVYPHSPHFPRRVRAFLDYPCEQPTQAWRSNAL